MKIEITREIPVSNEHGIMLGNVYNTISCPEEHSHLSLIDDGSVWIQSEIEPVRILSYEYMTVEISEEENFNENSLFSGKNITKISRERFMEGNYESSYKILNEIGLSKKQIKKILLGDAKLVSTNSDSITFIEEEDSVYKNYISKFVKQFFLYENKVYQPKSFVGDYGYLDRDFHLDFSIDGKKHAKRASYYVKEKSDIIAYCKYDGYDFNIIFKVVDLNDILFDLIPQNPQVSVDNLCIIKPHAYLENMGYSGYNIDVLGNYDFDQPDIKSPYEIAAEEELKEQLFQNSKELINAKAERFLGFFDLKVYDKVYQVPLAPFIIWFAPGYGAMHSEIDALKDGYGEPVSESNLKMRNDNRYHNDWVVGAGLDLETYYEVYHDESSGLEKGINQQIGIVLGYQDMNIQSLNIKKNSNVKLFVKPKEYGEVVSGDCLYINYPSDKDIENILTATTNGTGIVITSSSTKTAHLVSNATELDFSMFNVPNLTQTMYHLDDYIFEINLEQMTIEPFISVGTPLSLVSESNSKVGMLAKLNNNGIKVLDGVYLNSQDEIDNFKINIPLEQKYIIRSAGNNEGSNIKASGIFKSIVSESKEFGKNIQTVWSSFNTPMTQRYFERMGVSVEPGVLIQPYLNPDNSYVIKEKDNIITISYTEGDCSKIVNGEAGVKSIEFHVNDILAVQKDFPVLEVFEKIKSITNFKNLESEFIELDNVIYTTQTMEI